MFKLPPCSRYGVMSTRANAIAPPYCASMGSPPSDFIGQLPLCATQLSHPRGLSGNKIATLGHAAFGLGMAAPSAGAAPRDSMNTIHCVHSVDAKKGPVLTATCVITGSGSDLGAFSGENEAAALNVSTDAAWPAAAHARASSARRGIALAMVVLAEAVVPPDCHPASPIVELLQRLLPEQCPSATAAKRAVRRRLVLQLPASATQQAAAASAAPTMNGTAAGGVSRPPNADSAIGGPPSPYGIVATTLSTAGPCDVLQVLARSGTGHMGWVGTTGRRSSAGGAARWDEPTAGKSGGSRDDNDGSRGLETGGCTARQAGCGSELDLPGLPVAYEDDHMAVVIKPPGIETQGSGTSSAQGRLKYCLRPTLLVGALNRPQQVHRLDAPTGGLLLVAKTHTAMRGLAADLHHRRMAKRYCALVKGVRSGSGTIDMPLSGKPCLTSFAAVPVASSAFRPSVQSEATGPSPNAAMSHPGAMSACVAVTAAGAAAVPRAAASVGPSDENAAAALKAAALSQPPEDTATGPPYEGSSAGAVAAQAPVTTRTAGDDRPVCFVLSCMYGALTKVYLWPHTGRTHQLRKHMAYTGTPMLGDPRYRGPRNVGGGRGGGDGSGTPTESDGQRQQRSPPPASSVGLDADVPVTRDGGAGEIHGSVASRGHGLGQAALERAAGGATGEGAESEDEEAGVGSQCAPHDSACVGSVSDGATALASTVRLETHDPCDGVDWEVYRPEPDVAWVRSVAEAAVTLAGGGCGTDPLADGTAVSLCLWAVGLRFRHPVNRRGVEVDVTAWADVLFDDILHREAAAAAAAGMSLPPS